MLPLTHMYFTVIVVSTKTSCRTRQTMLAAGSPAGLAVSWMRPRPAAISVHAGFEGVQPVLAGFRQNHACRPWQPAAGRGTDDRDTPDGCRHARTGQLPQGLGPCRLAVDHRSQDHRASVPDHLVRLLPDRRADG